MLKWLLLATLFLAACTDYLGEFKDEYGSLASLGVDDDHGISSESNSTLPSSAGATPMSGGGFSMLSSSSIGSNSALPSSTSGTPTSGGSLSKSSSSFSNSSSSFSKSSSSSYASGYFLSASSNACGDMWCGRLKEYRVITGVDAGEDRSGYWYDYSDESDGGYSYIVFPDGGRDANGAMNYGFIDKCGGICGTAVLELGASSYAFAGIGFNVAGVNEEAADVTSWGGLCVVYSSTCDICLVLSNPRTDNMVNYNVPYASLRPGTGKVLNLDWSDFMQENWGNVTMTGADAAKQLVSINFRFGYSSEPLSCDFNIMSIGKYGTCK